MSRTRPRARSVVFACVMAICAGGSGFAGDYQLGPRDKVRIRVFDWRPAVSDTHEWTALTGEYSVSASGALSLPVVGEIPAAGRTTSEVADEISDLLKTKIGLTQRPAAAVEVREYRPFYILGQVTTPGEYAFRPNLTVVQAISMAGGVRRLDLNAFSLVRDGLASRGDLRALAAERIALMARQARLLTELKKANEIEFPKEVLDQASVGQGDRVVREERLLMQSRATALQSKADNMTQTSALLEHEIGTLQEKAAALQRQEGLAQKELDTVNALMAKGLAVTARQSQLEQTVSQFASSRLDVELLILRAKQDIARLTRERADLYNKQREDVLTELGDVRTKLAVIFEKLQTSQAMVSSLEVRDAHLAASTSLDGQKLGYRITRPVDGRWVTTTVSENDVVAPGDTVRVEWEDRIVSSRAPDVKEGEVGSQ